MNSFNRRDFVKSVGALSLAGTSAVAGIAGCASVGGAAKPKVVVVGGLQRALKSESALVFRGVRFDAARHATALLVPEHTIRAAGALESFCRAAVAGVAAGGPGGVAGQARGGAGLAGEVSTVAAGAGLVCYIKMSVLPRKNKGHKQFRL